MLTQCQAIIMEHRWSMKKNTIRKLVQFASAFVQSLACLAFLSMLLNVGLAITITEERTI